VGTGKELLDRRDRPHFLKKQLLMSQSSIIASEVSKERLVSMINNPSILVV
jgi:hypothetical protein